jgi:hypothetical protein
MSAEERVSQALAHLIGLRFTSIIHQKVEHDWVVVNDDRARDLPAFRRLCSAFDPDLIDVKVMDTAPWMPKQKEQNTEVPNSTP